MAKTKAEAKAGAAKRNPRVKIIEFDGKSLNVSQWAREIGIAPATLAHRLGKLGWSVEQALTKPKRKYTRKAAEQLAQAA